MLRRLPADAFISGIREDGFRIGWQWRDTRAAAFRRQIPAGFSLLAQSFYSAFSDFKACCDRGYRCALHQQFYNFPIH